MQQPLKKGKLLLVTSVVIILCSLGLLPSTAKAAEMTANAEILSYIQYEEGGFAGILHAYSPDYLTSTYLDVYNIPANVKWATLAPLNLSLDNGIEFIFSRDGKTVEKQFIHITNWSDIPSDVKWITVSNFDGDLTDAKNPITNQKYRYSVDGVNVVESATVPANALWATLSYYETISSGTPKRLKYNKHNYTLKFNRTPPVINLTKSPTGWTNGDVTVTANINSEGDLKIQKWDYGIRNESYFNTAGNLLVGSFISIDQNRTITWYARDVLLNSTVQTITIDNIDKDVPIITSGNMTITPDQKIEVPITITDSTSGVKTKKWAFGNQNESYFLTGGNTFTENKIVVDNFGTYTLFAEDHAGNKSISTVHLYSADLEGLQLNEGTLSPEFSKEILSYDVNVMNTVSTITVIPNAKDSTATVKVNGNLVSSGATSATIPLNVGSNTIFIEVTAVNSTKKTYQVKVTRAPSSNANLISLTLNSGILSPEISSGDSNYTASVENAITSLTVTPTAADATAKIKVNGHAVSSGTASNTIPLNVGENTVTIKVIAEDHTTQRTYTVTVTRFPSSNANLSDLTLSSGSFLPVFSGGDFTYTASVENAITSLTITPTAADATAKVKVNGHAVNSGTASNTIPLNVGENTVTIEVTAEDNTTQRTYTVTVTRFPSSNANLSDLTLSSGLFLPVFNGGDFTYSASVENTITSLTVTPTAADATAKVKVNGHAVSSGTASNTIPLNVGENTLTIEVTAEDNTTQQTYTVTVTRFPSSNANLSNLTLSSGSFLPVFNGGDFTYSASVENAITSLTITPTAADATAKIKVNGHAVNSGTASNTIPLNVGENTVTIEVIAEDNTTQRTYTVTVTRFPSSNANLSDLTLSSGSFLPVFSGGDFTYTASVENAITSLTVTPTAADATAKIKVNGHAVNSGTASNTIPLNVGENMVTIEVTAEDNTTQQTYTVTVTRFPSSNANFKSLTLNYGKLTPSFDSQREKYSVNVDVNVNSIDLTPILDDNDATLMINGLPSSSGKTMTVSLNFGVNTIILEITAPDGVTKRKYTVEVYRGQPPAPVDSTQIPGNSAPVEPAAPTVTKPAPIELPQLVPTDPMQPQEPITDIIFSDVPAHHWAYTMIGDFAKRGYITGYADGTFKPNDPISRQHVALIFSRIFKLNPIQEALTFKDIPLNHPYYETIKLVQQAGLYQGINGYFKPNENMSRAQLAKVLAIALNLSSASTHTFKDIPLTHWAHDYIIALAANDIALGDNGYFKPESSVTRAQFVAFLYRALQQ